MLWETPEIYERIKAMIPMGRMALPEELTGLALYLASDAASFTTGAVFYCGWRAVSRSRLLARVLISVGVWGTPQTHLDELSRIWIKCNT